MFSDRILKKVNELEVQMAEMSDKELQYQTKKFRQLLSTGSTLEQLMIEILATVREANKRVLGLFPTDEQVLGAIALLNGSIAEINTGEGKSLVATMPLYAHALINKGGVFLVTTNDYLAKRDFERIGSVYTWLGLNVTDGSNSFDKVEEKFNYEKKKIIYKADIIYTSNSTLGFDFLIDKLAASNNEKFLSNLNFALLDEVDDILLDSAQMPLIISGAPKVQSNYYIISDQFVRFLDKETDFLLDEENKNVWLTEVGIEKAKKYFSLDDILSKEHFSLYQHIILSLRAHYTLRKTRDYLVEEGKIKLLDSKDGRILEGTNLQSGLHQAIEAKEMVDITNETQTVSSVTYQNLFRSFHKVSGMSGTVKVAEYEFIETYNLSVTNIKTHKENIRKDHPPEQYVTFEAKLKAILKKIQEVYSTGRPMLIIAGTVKTSELLSLYLYNLGISHNLLNAKSSVKEAYIISEAGLAGSVTIATAMAGRGTDIKLDNEAIKKGGLVVILTERLNNKRVELQAKGRAGRQGEPGDTYVFESLEDDIIKQYMQESIQDFYNNHLYDRDKIKNRRIQRVFDKAQKKSEEAAYNNRKKSLEFDEVLKLQKQQVDFSRDKIIKLDKYDKIMEIVEKNAKIVLEEYFEKNSELTLTEVKRFVLDNLDYNFKQKQLQSLKLLERERSSVKEARVEFAMAILKNNWDKKLSLLNDKVLFTKYLQVSILKAIDSAWSNQVDMLNQLRFVVLTRQIAQKKAIVEFEKEAKKNFRKSQDELSLQILRNTSLSIFEIKKGELLITFP